MDERQAFEKTYGDLTQLRGLIAKILSSERERAQKLDMLRFQVNEINAAGLKPDEEEELAEEARGTWKRCTPVRACKPLL